MIIGTPMALVVSYGSRRGMLESSPIVLVVSYRGRRGMLESRFPQIILDDYKYSDGSGGLR